MIFEKRRKKTKKGKPSDSGNNEPLPNAGGRGDTWSEPTPQSTHIPGPSGIY